MRVDETAEAYAAPLAIDGHCQEVVVLSEQRTPEARGAVEQRGIVEAGCPVLVCGQDVDYPQAQAGEMARGT